MPVLDRRRLDDWSLCPGHHLQCVFSALFPPPEVPQDISPVTPPLLSDHDYEHGDDDDNDTVPQAVAAVGTRGHAAPGHFAHHLLAADPGPGPGGVRLHHQVVTAHSSGQYRTKVTRGIDDTIPRARW